MRIVAALLVVVAALAAAEAKPRYRSRRNSVAPGVTLVRIRDRVGPNRIRVLEVDPRTAGTLDVALATEVLPGHETTSSMAHRHHALAAINGDFTLRPQDRGSGRPIDTFIEDGHLKASPLIWGRNFSISQDESDPRIGHNRLRTWIEQTSGERWAIKGVNPLDPAATGYSLYTSAGKKMFRPPNDACYARLYPSSVYRWNRGQNGLTRGLFVDEVVCRHRRLRRFGGDILSAPIGSSAGIAMVATLAPGEVVDYGWKLKRPGAVDTIGGNPDLVEDGRIAVSACHGSYFCYRNPRTGVGVTPGGKVLLVTVDGRSRGSVGMTPEQFAKLFLHLGATWALNMDGGGSTTMVVRDRIVNTPSSGYERPVGSALILLPGEDADEVTPERHRESSEASPSPTPSETAPPMVSSPVLSPVPIDGFQAIDPACAALLDAGSTGGMLDALDKGLLGPHRLPRSLRWAVRMFRSRSGC